jgi:hypothetical protein
MTAYRFLRYVFDTGAGIAGSAAILNKDADFLPVTRCSNGFLPGPYSNLIRAARKVPAWYRNLYLYGYNYPDYLLFIALI